MTDRPQVELAGLRRRLAALVYEALLLLGVLALLYLIPHLVYGIVAERAAPGWFSWLHIAVVLGAYFLYYWCRSGQTLAMQTWRLRVVTADEGKPVPWRQGLLRYVLAWPSVWLFGAGLWWALIDRDRQFAHDRLAGTAIILLPAGQKMAA
ncbi:RDD family protein [Denitromonas iodatirespirans]|uniref:RDD family protein n=1 Tax=Denitromonas iodatirespirans TaxID=2795389 RepID=UPI001E41A8A6|nr:RDD family protein [Denitromonas iodatirespirans]